jgi:hypothetical protein
VRTSNPKVNNAHRISKLMESEAKLKSPWRTEHGKKQGICILVVSVLLTFLLSQSRLYVEYLRIIVISREIIKNKVNVK